MAKMPIVIFSGAAGSGKDTAAQLLGEQLAQRGISMTAVALADPMKRIAARVFDFSEDQLWGSLKERPDSRYEFGQRHWRLLLGGALDEMSRVLEWTTAVQDHSRQKFCDFLDTVRQSQEFGYLSPRVLLQLMGTEWGRSADKNRWIKMCLRLSRELLSDPEAHYSRSGGLQRPQDCRRTDLVAVTDGRFRNEILGVKGAGGLAIRIVNPEHQVSAVGLPGHSSEMEMNSIPDFWFDAVIYNDKSKGLEAFREKLEVLAEQFTTEGIL